MADSLAGDLRQHIYQAHADGPRSHWATDEPSSHWVMSMEWFNEVRKLDDSAGRAVSGPVFLLGMPVEVREDGGVPHLELDG